MKIRPVGAELLHADGQTDMTKLTVALRNCANRLKTEVFTNSSAGSEEVQWQDVTNRAMNVNVVVQTSRHFVINFHSAAV